MSVAQLEALGYVEHIDRYNEITQWRTFARDESLLCYVKDDIVIAIACFANCYIEERNIIGMNKKALFSMLGFPSEIGNPLWVTDDEQQQPLEYEEAGLQIWLEGGKVVSVFCDDGGN